jgi:UDP-N-acetylmuramate dehydrogenase
MRDHTSIRIGGRAALMLFPRSAGELCRAAACCRGLGSSPSSSERHQPPGGEGELPIVVIKTHGGLDGVCLAADGTVEAERAPCSPVGCVCSEHGLTGFEFAHGIPGSRGRRGCDERRRLRRGDDG